jgi:hypothetical protein
LTEKEGISGRVISVKATCGKIGMTRQNYYSLRKRRKEDKVDSDFIIKEVCSERVYQPRVGGRKLHYMLRGILAKAGISIGRDRMFDLLRENDLLVKRKKIGSSTTDSRHSLPVFHNLIKDMEVTCASQV